MKTFDTQAAEIQCDHRRAFYYIADPKNLPEWTHAFKSATPGSALMETPQGSVPVKLTVDSSADHGTIDWLIEFPDGSRTTAFSRLIDAGNNRSIYTFTLIPPPVPLERIEGALEQQSLILREELQTLARILGSRK